MKRRAKGMQRFADYRRTVKLERLEAAMDGAESFQRWLELAEEHDELSGAMDWRRREESRLFDHGSIQMRLRRLRRLLRTGDDRRLLFALNEGIHGNMGGMGRPRLYDRAYTGTKLLIGDYVDAICDSLERIASPAAAAIPLGERLHFFQRASHCYGRSALMLSGGGTLGYFHLGVLKALMEQGLCPEVVSGASAGAFVAGILGTRTDEQFLALFEDDYLAGALTENRGKIELGFFRREPADVQAIRREIARLIPDMTFLEAYEKSGRAINITISPAEPHQTSRLLNHIASPNVTILSAIMASSALPGVFPPVQLQARSETGQIRPYLPIRRWIDGSLSQDLPAKRLARLYGVNHFIVSQVLPGVGRERYAEPGLRKTLSDASVAATKQMVRGVFDTLQRRTRVPPQVGTAMNMINGLIDQRFTGDINIFPGYGYSSLGKVLRMLDRDEMRALFEAGERATWPKLPMIETTTRIGRTLDRILHEFEAREQHWLSSSGKRGERARGADPDVRAASH
jgi:NTE family protein